MLLIIDFTVFVLGKIKQAFFKSHKIKPQIAVFEANQTI